MPRDFLSLEESWHRHDDFTWAPVGRKEKLCIYAQNLSAWTEENCLAAMKSRNVIAIHQATLLLVHQYFNYKAAIPKDHRQHYSERGHICIFTVFERVFHRLNAELLRINPPVLTEPSPAPTTVIKQYRIDSFPIGEVEEDEDEDA